MSTRERILARIRAAATHARRRPVPPRPRVPADLARHFCQRLDAASATFEWLADLSTIGARVLAYRRHAGLRGPTAVAPTLSALDWPAELSVELGSTDGRALLAVSRAEAGVAETGSLVLFSGPGTPTRLNFLPDHHIVLLDPARIVRHLEDAWSNLAQPLPRAINLVTGPSRTADVEQTIQLGAHGPRCLHVLLVTLSH